MVPDLSSVSLLSERRYHHGDLRRALIDAALEEIDRNGANSLSLRSLARSAGVSHSAPAYHFGDKTGIFTAIATEGFRRLNEAQQLAVDGLAPEDTLITLTSSYVRFAVSHRSHFELMWRTDLYDSSDETLIAMKTCVFDQFRRSLQATAGAVSDEALSGAVAACSALVHGFATLSLDGSLIPLVGQEPLGGARRAADGLSLFAEIVADQLTRSKPSLSSEIPADGALGHLWRQTR